MVEVGELMNFIMATTVNLSSKLSEEAEASLRKVFLEHLGEDKQEMDFEEFKRIIPCKKDFFVRRIFSIFDKDRMGSVSLQEFVESVQQFCPSSTKKGQEPWNWSVSMRNKPSRTLADHVQEQLEE